MLRISHATRSAPAALPTVRSLRAVLATAVLATALAVTALAVMPGTTYAQTPEREPAVVELSAGTRAMALGGAYQLGMPDSDVLFSNPALLEGAGGSLTGGGHLLGDDALGFTVSAARAWFGGGVGLGLRVLEYGSPGPGLRSGGLDPLLASNGPGVTEMAMSLGVSRRIFGVRVGMAGKVVAQRYPDFRQAAGALDLGIAHDLGPLTAGLAIRDIGSDRSLAPGGDISQPTSVTLGVGAYGRRLGPLDVGLATALTLRDDEELVAGGGLEVGYWPVVGRTFVVRLGSATVPDGDASPFTVGASYWGDELVLDYAWRSVGDAGSVHRVSVGWR